MTFVLAITSAHSLNILIENRYFASAWKWQFRREWGLRYGFQLWCLTSTTLSCWFYCRKLRVLHMILILDIDKFVVQDPCVSFWSLPLHLNKKRKICLRELFFFFRFCFWLRVRHSLTSAMIQPASAFYRHLRLTHSLVGQLTRNCEISRHHFDLGPRLSIWDVPSASLDTIATMLTCAYAD